MDPKHPGLESVLPHEGEDSLAADPPRNRRPLARVTIGLLVGIGLLAAYQVGLLLAAGPYSTAPGTATPTLMPEGLVVLLAAVQVLPYSLPGLWLAFSSDSAKPRWPVALLIGVGLWLAPLYHPPAFASFLPLVGWRTYLISLTPAVAGSLAGGLLGDLLRRRPPSGRGLRIAEIVAGAVVCAGLLLLATEIPSAREVARICVAVACLIGGVVAGIALRGHSWTGLCLLAAASSAVWVPWRPLLVFGREWAAFASPAVMACIVVVGAGGWWAARVWVEGGRRVRGGGGSAAG